MIFLATLIFFIFGLIIGSFLNVVILRMNTKRSLGGRSSCMTCQNKLCWYELIPFLSFVVLRGRCKNCKIKISLQYPLVEIMSGFIFAAIFLKFQDLLFLSSLEFIITYLYYAFLFCLLLIIVVYDLRHKIIPDRLSLIFGVLTFVGLFFFHVNNFSIFYNSSVFYWHLPTILDLLAGLFISVPFFLFWFVSDGMWMGLGDAKLAIGLGWFLGFPLILSAAVLAFWVGAVVGVGLIVLSNLFKKHSRYNFKSEIPFAPYLVLGLILVFFFDINLFLFFW